MQRAGIAGLTALLIGAAPALAQEDPAAFYAGKTVRIIVGIGVGSGYDTTARLIGRHIGKHIPGKPDVIVSNQTGAGSMTMSNQLYAAGPKDGTVIGAPFNGMPTMPLLSPESARFDPTKLGWVGSANRAYQASYVWHTAPIKTMDDVLKQTFVVGSQAPGSSQHDYPATANVLFGTKFKIINGYEATPKIHLAMERGEVMGSAATSWSTVKAITGDWLKEGKIKVIGQFALKKHPELPDVPLWLDLAKTEQQKQAMNLLLVRLEFGVPYFMPPDVPVARLNAIRRAFDATMADPAYRSESERAKLEVDPMTGEDVQKLVEQTMKTPPEVVKLVRDAMAAAQ